MSEWMNQSINEWMTEWMNECHFIQPMFEVGGIGHVNNLHGLHT